MSEQTNNERTPETVEKELAEARSAVARLENERGEVATKRAEALSNGAVERAALSGKPLPKEAATLAQREAELPMLIDALKLRVARLNEEHLALRAEALEAEHQREAEKAREKLAALERLQEEYRVARDVADAVRWERMDAQQQLGAARRWRAYLEAGDRPQAGPQHDPNDIFSPEQRAQMQGAAAGLNYIT